MRSLKRFFKNGNIGLLFVAPAVIYMFAFIGYPIVSNFILSFQDITVMTINSPDKPFIGFDNYIRAFHDPIVATAVWNTLLFTVSCIVFQFIIGFALALFFKKGFKLAKPVRGLMMIPWMIPITITGLMFRFIFASNVGVINELLMITGIIGKPIDWLLQPGTAMLTLIIANIWIGIPFNMILLSSGLSLIPEELYESASIDGASKVQNFRYITLPMMRSTIEAVLILGFIYTFKVFDLVYVMTQGGPVDSTQMLSTYAYKLSFSLFRYSDGATVANILFVILFAVSLLYLRFVNTNEGEA
jgi:multiple sugar transport system permease protein